MRLCSDKPCVVILTRQDTCLRINGQPEITLPANNMVLMHCENNTIDFPDLPDTLVAHIDRNIIKDYLSFLNKDLTHTQVWQRSALPFITASCRTPDIFQEAALRSIMETSDICEIECTRALLFTVLSTFLTEKKFIPLLMYMLRNSISDSVYNIIRSDLHKGWNLSMVASSLCLSPSLLKKKLKSENTSYSQIVTDCRMRHAVNQLMMNNKNISQVSRLCGYSSTSYFISVFKEFYGMTPLNYVYQYRKSSTTG